MGRFILGMALFAAVSLPSWASSWVALGEGGDGQFMISVDLDSLQQHGAYRTVVERFAYRRPAQYPGGRWIYAVTAHRSYECQQRTALLLQGFAYGDANATVPIATVKHHNIPANYAVVAPHSPEDTVFKRVCAPVGAVSWPQ